IHKAKGLEAPVVIYPWRMPLQFSPQTQICLHKVQDLKVATRLSKEEGVSYYDEYLGVFLECLNLLYVATTRPREELYLLCEDRRDADKDILKVLCKLAQIDLPLSQGELPSDLSSLIAPKDQEALPSFASLPTKPFNQDNCTAHNLAENCASAKPSILGSQEKIAAKSYANEDLNELQSLTYPTQSQNSQPFAPMAWLPSLRIAKSKAWPTSRAMLKGMLLHKALLYLTWSVDKNKAVNYALNFALTLEHWPNFSLEEREQLRQALLWLLNLSPSRHWLEQGLREQTILLPKQKLYYLDLLVPPKKIGEPWLLIDYKSSVPRKLESLVKAQEKLRLCGQVLAKRALKWEGLLLFVAQRRWQKILPTKNGPLVAPKFQVRPSLLDYAN
ncbi:MAG: hypothetical protein IJS50_05215, partial [Desulfovibrio sp.]|nr:hypothetical protein [Desulfovibrio sp.]